MRFAVAVVWRPARSLAGRRVCGEEWVEADADAGAVAWIFPQGMYGRSSFPPC